MTRGLVYRIRDDVNNATGAVDPVLMECGAQHQGPLFS